MPGQGSVWRQNQSMSGAAPVSIAGDEIPVGLDHHVAVETTTKGELVMNRFGEPLGHLG